MQETRARHPGFVVALILLQMSFGSVAEAGAVQEQPQPPELRGILFLSGSRQFALTTAGGAESGWASIGGTFAGWKLDDYREEDEALQISRGGKTVELQLVPSEVVDARSDKATLKDAEAVMEKMNFEEMFGRMIEQQKASVMKLTRQMVVAGGKDDVSADEVAEFQGRVMELMWSEMNPKQMAHEMTQIYSDVFTRSELRGLSEFYSTAAGRAMVEKQPEIQQRLMAIIQPRMISVMPRVREMAQEYERQHKGAREAQSESGAGGGDGP